MKKTIASIIIFALLLCSFGTMTKVEAFGQNPFTDNDYSFFVWDDLSGKANKTLVTPTSGSNEDINYYSGNGQTIYQYQNEKLRIAKASGSQLAMLTTGRHANKYSTRNTEGYGCYIKNNSGSSMEFRPLLVGNDFYQMNASSTAYLVTSTGTASTVTSNSNGGVTITSGFEGFIAIPYTSMYPCWGNVTAFEPGKGDINFFSVNITSTFSQGTNYIDIDNMFLYGENCTANNEYLIKGGSSTIPLEAQMPNPFSDASSNYFIWDDLSGMSDMTIPLPPDGQENTYVKYIYGAGTQVYKYEGQKLKISGSTDWKNIQLKTNRQATAAQTANAAGIGFYVSNQCGKDILVQPLFRDNTKAYTLKASSKFRFVNMDGWSHVETAGSLGVITVPQSFEGYILVQASSLAKSSGGDFTPGTDSLVGFSVNVCANFTNDGIRKLVFDNMFLYGYNLSTTTSNAVSTLFPPSPAPGTPSQQTVAAPSSEGSDGNKLVGIDQFNRTFETIIGEKGSKDVGMFYWLWAGQPISSGVYDMSEFIKTQSGINELFNPNSTVAPAWASYYWGKPIFGYYNINDDYVMRKHIEMLTLAGVDFLILDYTNYAFFPVAHNRLFKLLDEYQDQGWNVPKIVFYTHAHSIYTMVEIYNQVYKQNMYPNLWYNYNGKPLIIGYKELMDDYGEAITRGDENYYTKQLPTEIGNFFSFKYPQWPNEQIYADGFPYVEWVYPQPVHNDLINVSAASQHGDFMSTAFFDRTKCWGRGFDFNTNTNIAADADKGTFFQAQWNQAFKEDPDIAIIDGWNEDIGGKVIWGGSAIFCDAFGKEFSRDIEVMDGGYEDAFYLQTIKNIRQFKGLTGKNYLNAGKTVNITGAVSQWDTGTRVYKAVGTTNYGRDAYDYAGINRYSQAAPRNNIQEIRVVNDNSYIYFYIMCADNITTYDSSNNWMNIFIGTGNPAPGGWNGYDFVLNRSVNMGTGKSDITALSGNFSGSKAGEADIALNGRLMMLKVSRSALGLSTGQASGAEFYFKVADAVSNPQTIQNYYISGKSLPMGRLSYSYSGVKPSNIASAINPITDTSTGIQVYESFASRSDMQVPLVSQGTYLWQAPDSNNYKMSFNKNRLLMTKAPVNNTTEFMLYLAGSTSGMNLTGMQGVGFYVRNNTADRLLVSPLECGDHAFYMPKGKSAKLIDYGGNLSLIYDTNEYSDRSSFSVPAGFEGYITFAASDFTCMWHTGCPFTAGNFALNYFSLKMTSVGGCNEAIGNSIVFDNMFFYGAGMTPYNQSLVRPATW